MNRLPQQPPRDAMKTAGSGALRKAALWTAVLLALGLVFGLYLQPQFMLSMADQVWGCF